MKKALSLCYFVLVIFNLSSQIPYASEFDEIPIELHVHILSFLDLKSIKSFALVGQPFYEIANNKKLLIHLYLEKLKEILRNVPVLEQNEAIKIAQTYFLKALELVDPNDPKTMRVLLDLRHRKFGYIIIDEHFYTPEMFIYYQNAAKSGHPVAQNNLAIMFVNGLGTQKNYEEALRLNEESAKQGNSFGQNTLGFMYEFGLGLKQSYENAIKYYTFSADQGNPVAQYNLGLLYLKAQGVEQNDLIAFNYFQASSTQGWFGAKRSLGYMYLTGKGVEKNIQKAWELIQASANEGDVFAQNHIALLKIREENQP